MSDPASFRRQFPALARVAYLNAGTEGPLPARAAEAARRRLEFELAHGRCGTDYFEETMGLAGALRSAYAELLGCGAHEVALTGSTTDGINTVLSGLGLRAGEEVLTSDEEHPGLLAPLGLLRRRNGVEVRVVPFAELARSVSARTRLIACSHVSWVSGRVVDLEALRGAGVPVLLDGAQGIGAVASAVAALGCDFYAASGQKWLCGPEGSGCLFVRSEWIDELTIPWPGYGSLSDPEHALELGPAAGAARFDHGFPSGLRSAWALASLEVLAEAGWQWVLERAAGLAGWLAQRLATSGLEVAPRGRSTLVSWRPPGGRDAAEEVSRLAASGLVVRSVPGFGLVRASVGAWSSEEELERLAELAAAE